MAVLNEITVGDIVYQIIDSFPTHVALNGTIAIYPQKKIIFINIDSNTDWASLIVPAHGEMRYIAENTTATNPVAGTWNNDDVGGWVAGKLKGMSVIGSRMTLDAGVSGRFLCTADITISSASSRIYDCEFGLALRNTVPTITVTSRILSGNSTQFNSAKMFRMESMFGELGDFINFGKRWLSNTGGGPQNGFIIKYARISVIKIANTFTIPLFTETFESGSFNTNGWVVVNGAESNKWFVTQNDPFSGLWSAHISDHVNGNTVNYSITSTSVVHFYKDITFPTGGDIVGFELEYTWKATGENAAGQDQYDFGRIFILPAGTSVVAGTIPSIAFRAGVDKHNLQATFITTVINISALVNPGETKRVCFTWVNDNAGGVQPPWVIDDIKIKTNQL
jgi:hypothetical protein